VVLPQALPPASMSSPSGFSGQLSPQRSSSGEPDEHSSLTQAQPAFTRCYALTHQKCHGKGFISVLTDGCTVSCRIPARRERRDFPLDEDEIPTSKLPICQSPR